MEESDRRPREKSEAYGLKTECDAIEFWNKDRKKGSAKCLEFHTSSVDDDKAQKADTWKKPSSTRLASRKIDYGT